MGIQTSGVGSITKRTKDENPPDVRQVDERGRQETSDDHQNECGAVGGIDELYEGRVAEDAVSLSSRQAESKFEREICSQKPTAYHRLRSHSWHPLHSIMYFSSVFHRRWNNDKSNSQMPGARKEHIPRIVACVNVVRKGFRLAGLLGAGSPALSTASSSPLSFEWVDESDMLEWREGSTQEEVKGNEEGERAREGGVGVRRGRGRERKEAEGV